jgi:4-alpha-glucanotransferase
MFSLPGREPVGTIAGPDTLRFLDQLVEAGFSFWQILPVPPDGANECPYSGTSAFAVEPMLLGLEDLAADGVLSAAEWAQAQRDMPVSDEPDRVPWQALRAWKDPLLDRAAQAVSSDQIEAWLEDEGWWAFDYAAWWALSRELKAGWQDWPAPLRDREPARVRAIPAEHREAFHRAAALQLLVDRQWSKLRRELRGRGLRIMGDIPLYVAGSGADCWAHRPMFQLAADGRAEIVAGAPPDAFTDDGQRWDNPVFDWEHSASTGHAWWRQRFRRIMNLVDEVRIDHFRGFSAYFSFPFEGSPREGWWTPGPGRGLFEALAAEYGQMQERPVRPEQLPVVVEDLGFIDEQTVALRDGLGFPGTKVLQFGFDGDSNNPHHPCHFPDRNCVACTGTHDNQTARGWYESAPDWVRHHFGLMWRGREASPARGLVRLALESVADHVVLPLQDVLDLDDRARVNIPGTVHGNWMWRAPWMGSEDLAWIRALHAETLRTPLAGDPAAS